MGQALPAGGFKEKDCLYVRVATHIGKKPFGRGQTVVLFNYFLDVYKSYTDIRYYSFRH